ncbi:hypothetical protein ACH9D2_18535 [Kocuria sp. M4R2S49]|uniref:hypothetical protein n=1 Tax=Kocuria rhizosphaericola TaxID=3376284 RepID=UPI003790D464
MGIAWSHYRFREACTTQGHDLADLPYRARFFPLGPVVALGLCAVVILGQNYQAFLGDLDLTAALSAYIGLPMFLALWAGHRILTGSRMVRYEDADLTRAHD